MWRCVVAGVVSRYLFKGSGVVSASLPCVSVGVGVAMKIGNREIGLNHPTYFIADIGANHDGNLDKACELVHLAAEAGADAVKFQHFRADHIVSEKGFASLPKMAHQKAWKDSVFSTFQKLETPWKWTPTLANACRVEGVEFMSTPYDLEAVAHLDPYVNAWKVGSGDITYHGLICKIADTGKPVILSTGASTIKEVHDALWWLWGRDVVLMQCNTNYTGSLDNIRHANLNVLKTYAGLYPGAVLGLSDHTKSTAVVLGAVAFGARVIERHFGSSRGPDGGFSLSPYSFKEMVRMVRDLEKAFGSHTKQVCENEKEARIVQRRAMWDGRALRPCPPDREGELV